MTSSGVIDLAIIGGGPAALSASLYAARSGLKTVVFEKGNFGGELSQIIEISNYPGYVGRGDILTRQMKSQAEQAGAVMRYGECTKIEKSGTNFALEIDGDQVLAHTVLIATGNEPKRLEYELQVPVSYCSLCDIPFVKDKNIVVVGGGDSAVQEAIGLARLAKQVTLVSRSRLKARKPLQERLKKVANLLLQEETEITKEFLERFDRVFVFIGHRPATSFAPAEILAVDGTVVTGAGVKAFAQDLDLLGLEDLTNKKPHETVISGLFAAGDVRHGAVRQVVTAAGDGAAAAIEIIDRLENQ